MKTTVIMTVAVAMAVTVTMSGSFIVPLREPRSRGPGRRVRSTRYRLLRMGLGDRDLTHPLLLLHSQLLLEIDQVLDTLPTDPSDQIGVVLGPGRGVDQVAVQPVYPIEVQDGSGQEGAVDRVGTGIRPRRGPGGSGIGTSRYWIHGGLSGGLYRDLSRDLYRAFGSSIIPGTASRYLGIISCLRPRDR
jgi:hypothetical protein